MNFVPPFSLHIQGRHHLYPTLDLKPFWRKGTKVDNSGKVCRLCVLRITVLTAIKQEKPLTAAAPAALTNPDLANKLQRTKVNNVKKPVKTKQKKTCEIAMSSALSSAYVLLGKATMSDPPDWSTAVGAIHSLSSLLSCSICIGVVGPHPHATPNDSYSLVCDKCDVKPTDQDCPELLKLLMDNIRNLCSYALNTYKHVPKLEPEESSDEDMKDDILVVPTQSSQAKFVSKLRKFSKVYFQLEQEIFPLKRTVPVTSVRTQPALLTSPPKAVIVTSPAKPTLSNGSGQSRPGQWIKVHHSKPATTTKRSNSLIKINGNKFGRDQIVKTTLRPSLNFPFKHQTTAATTTTSLKLNDLNNKLNDFVVKLDEIPTKVLQVNICQMYFLTHNMTKNCSMNYEFSTRILQEQMSRTCCLHKLF